MGPWEVAGAGEGAGKPRVRHADAAGPHQLPLPSVCSQRRGPGAAQQAH